MNVIEKILNKNDVIETDRLQIYPCPLDANILKDLWEIYSDSENVNGFTTTYFDIEHFAGIMSDKIVRHQNQLKGFIAYVIENKSNKKVIGIRNIILDGFYNYHNQRQDNNLNVTAEIVINKKYWRMGYALEASNAIFNYLSDNGIKYVGAFLDQTNNRSLELCRSQNFEEVTSYDFVNEKGFHKDHRILHENIIKPRFMVKSI